jgi:hypothetical protein
MVSITHRPRYYLSASDTQFCYRLSKPQGLVQLEGLGKLKKLIHLIGSRTATFWLVAVLNQLKNKKTIRSDGDHWV